MAPETQPASDSNHGAESQTAQATIEPPPQQQQAPSQSQSQEAPASPPLPARHTALTPGPRASRFQTTLDSALSHTLAKISWDNFAACYPHIAAHAPATLRAVQTQMVDRLRSLCKVCCCCCCCCSSSPYLSILFSKPPPLHLPQSCIGG